MQLFLPSLVTMALTTTFFAQSGSTSTGSGTSGNVSGSTGRRRFR